MEFESVDYFNTQTLKERWKCSKNSIYNYVKNGSIPFIRTPGGRILLFPADEIFEYESKQPPEIKKTNKVVRKKRKALSAPKKIWRAE